MFGKFEEAPEFSGQVLDALRQPVFSRLRRVS
jgi:hypothetical protein